MTGIELPPAGQLAESAAAAVARGAVAFVREPENLAGLAGAMLVPLAIFRTRRPPLTAWMLAALAGDQMFRRAYRAGEDLADLAAAARDGGCCAAGADTTG